MNAIYNLRALAPDHFALGKFDEDFNVAAVYNLKRSGNGYSCDCPASARSVKLKPCKHQRMLRVMMGAVNTNRFYDPESGAWSEPLADDPAVIDNRETEMTIETAIDQANLTGADPYLAGIQAKAQPVQPPKASPSSTPIVTRRI